MAAGSAFSLTTTEVVTQEPKYNNIITQAESMKKEYYNLSSIPTEIFVLKFHALTNTQRDTLLDHYNDQSGGYYLFSWQSVPSYINGGSNISGRWVDKSLKMTPVSWNWWSCSLSFEKNI